MSRPTSETLTSKRCLPCEGGVERLTPREAREHIESLSGWSIRGDGLRIHKDWVARSFAAAITFFNLVAELSETEGHHPDLHLEGYRNVRIEIWTHAIGGLSENDFILAAKIDLLPIKLKSD